ncbi:hypothetical protein [Roseivirga sp. E12]|uniref:hypothetical protein n=1 Tax=Roseivirga sp. E12 TaxID=2819237 RepID=UPI001ABC4587|nr:hypothetical protein [Roseivirga sp. E12]MBO3697966.1 hypothetical protein [Roseivirga sp. E12]
MIVTTTNLTPTPKELLGALREGLSDRYSYKLAGLGTGRTVIVSAWWLTIAQITIHENEIRVQKPSRVRTFFSAIVRYCTGFAMPFGPWKENLQQQLTTFLKREYN